MADIVELPIKVKRYTSLQRRSVFNPAEIRSMFHSCYNGLQFPEFARPLKGSQFGTKIMAQGTSAQMALEGQRGHAFTICGSGDDGWVWMNLVRYDGSGTKAVPVKLSLVLPYGFKDYYFLSRTS